MLNTTTLANGVRIISQSMSGHRTVSLGLWLQNGSRHDGRQRHGFAHLLEHLLADSLYSGRQAGPGYQRAPVGSQLHASSGRELTVWYGQVPGRYLTDLAMRFSSLLLQPDFQTDALQREQAIIRHEISDDDNALNDFICSLVWPGQEVGLPVSGNPQSLLRMDGKLLDSYFRQCVQGRKLVITAAGDVNHHALVSACRELESIPNDGMTTHPPAAPRFVSCQTRIPLPADRSRLCWAIPVPAPNTEDFTALAMACQLLAGDVTSRLHQRLRQQEQLIYSLTSEFELLSDGGIWFLTTSCDPHAVSRCQDIVMEECRRLAGEPIPDHEWLDCQRNMMSRLALEDDDPHGTMERLARDTIVFNKALTLAEHQKKILFTERCRLQQVFSRAWSQQATFVWGPEPLPSTTDDRQPGQPALPVSSIPA